MNNEQMIEEIQDATMFSDSFDPSFVDKMEQILLDGGDLTLGQETALENIHKKWVH